MTSAWAKLQARKRRGVRKKPSSCLRRQHLGAVLDEHLHLLVLRERVELSLGHASDDGFSALHAPRQDRFHIFQLSAFPISSSSATRRIISSYLCRPLTSPK